MTLVFLLWFATFTPPEKVALTSAFLVLIGVIGEYVVEVKAVEERKLLAKRIKRLSKALLVLGLSGDVLGIVMGQSEMAALTRESGDAATSARTARQEADAVKGIADEARADAKDALAKAQAAQRELARAEADAAEAQTVASNALKNIASAKKQVADIAKQLAPRTLNAADWDAMGEKLKPFAQSLSGRKVAVSSYSQDAEGIVFSVEIIKCLERAGIAYDPVVGRIVPVGLVEMGVKITGPVKDAEVIKLLAREIHDRADTAVNAEWNDKYNDLSVAVCAKPIAGLPTILH